MVVIVIVGVETGFRQFLGQCPSQAGLLVLDGGMQSEGCQQKEICLKPLLPHGFSSGRQLLLKLLLFEACPLSLPDDEQDFFQRLVVGGIHVVGGMAKKSGMFCRFQQKDNQANVVGLFLWRVEPIEPDTAEYQCMVFITGAPGGDARLDEGKGDGRLAFVGRHEQGG